VHGGSYSNLEANQTQGVLLYLSVGNAGMASFCAGWVLCQGCCAGWVLDSKCITRWSGRMYMCVGTFRNCY